MADTLEDQDVQQPLNPDDTLGARLSTIDLRSDANARRSSSLRRTVRGLRKPYNTTVLPVGGRDLGGGDDLTRLQQLVAGKVQGRIDNVFLERLFSDRPLTQDLYLAIFFALEYKLVDPNLVLLQAIPVTVGGEPDYDHDEGTEPQREYIQVIGAALRSGADPNVYVDYPDQVQKFHIIYFIHTLNAVDDFSNVPPAERDVFADELEAQESAKDGIIALLILAGSDPELPITDIDKLALDDMTTVQAILKNPDGKKSIIYNIRQDADDPIVGIPAEYASRRGDIIEEVVVYQNHIEDLVTADPDNFSPERVVTLGYLLDQPRASTFLVDDSAVRDQMQIPLQFRADISYKTLLDRIPRDALRAITQLDDGTASKIGVEELYNACEAINGRAAKLLLNKGIVPDYQLKDLMIENARLTVKVLPFSELGYIDILALFSSYGYELDDEQLKSIATFDSLAYSRLRDYANRVPFWKRICSVTDNDATLELRDLAKDVGLDPTRSKAKICKGLQAIAARPPEVVKRVAKQRQDRRIAAATTSLEDDLNEIPAGGTGIAKKIRNTDVKPVTKKPYQAGRKLIAVAQLNGKEAFAEVDIPAQKVTTKNKRVDSQSYQGNNDKGTDYTYDNPSEDVDEPMPVRNTQYFGSRTPKQKKQNNPNFVANQSYSPSQGRASNAYTSNQNDEDTNIQTIEADAIRDSGCPVTLKNKSTQFKRSNRSLDTQQDEDDYNSIYTADKPIITRRRTTASGKIIEDVPAAVETPEYYDTGDIDDQDEGDTLNGRRFATPSYSFKSKGNNTTAQQDLEEAYEQSIENAQVPPPRRKKQYPKPDYISRKDISKGGVSKKNATNVSFGGVDNRNGTVNNNIIDIESDQEGDIAEAEIITSKKGKTKVIAEAIIGGGRSGTQKGSNFNNSNNNHPNNNNNNCKAPNKSGKCKKKRCGNDGTLPFDPDEYSDINIVSYEDDNGDCYNFVSQDFIALTQAKINPFTGDPLPLSVIREMKAKLKELSDEGLSNVAVPISQGIARINGRGGNNAVATLRSQQAVRELTDYYKLFQDDYIYPELLSSDYTVDDMQDVIDTLYGEGEVTLDVRNRNHALYTFANILLQDINDSADVNERVNEIFTVIEQQRVDLSNIQANEPQTV